MNYKKIYDALITQRLSCAPSGYTEQHHIVPKSLGGSDDSSNLVTLTAREHFIAHLILARLFPEGSISWVKMQKALWRMFSISINQKRISPSRWYEYAKEKASRAAAINQSGVGNSQYGKVWVHNKTLRQSTSIKRDKVSLYINEGWEIGRVMNWNKTKKVKVIDEEALLERERQKAKEFAEKVELYTKYYQQYNLLGWKNFVKLTGYDKSKPNLVMQFKKYVKEFVPQNGKKRGVDK